jgi:TRAP-type mannitol/chloroaromatic compound transport system permease large subunit
VTEAAGVGCIGAILVSIIYRKLTWAKLKEGLTSSIKLTGMIMWICMAGTLYAGVLRASGSANVIQELIIGLPLGSSGIFIFMLVIALILGMIMDPVSITLVTIPLFVPIMASVGIDLVLFGVLYSISLCIGQLTPPFAMTLFYFKAIVPDESIGDIYRASVPWVILMAIVLFMCIVFPELVLWLPSLMLS